MKDKYLTLFMKLAFDVAALSHSKKLKVGAVLVRDNNILSIGYNGDFPGGSNEIEKWDEERGEYITFPHILHAEENAIHKLARSPETSVGATLFITHPPCLHCFKLIVNTGIKDVYYGTDYKHKEGALRLIEEGIPVYYYPYVDGLFTGDNFD